MRLLPEALLLTETRAGMQTAIFANEAFLRLSGYSMTEVLDHDLRFLQGPETDPSAFTGFLQPPKAEQISGHEVVLYKKDGTPFWDKVSARAFADYCIQVHQEIGRQKEVERQLIVSQKREAVSHLVSGIAHDFNNLLTVIMVYSDLLLHKMGPGLADNIGQGLAAPDEFRTTPLWGVGQRMFFLHDGRTSDLLAAIQAHFSTSTLVETTLTLNTLVLAGSCVVANNGFAASEANKVIQNFNALSVTDKQAILDFLRSL